MQLNKMICFTICLFISPDLDGHRHHDMFHDMFVHKSGPKMKYCPTETEKFEKLALRQSSARQFFACFFKRDVSRAATHF